MQIQYTINEANIKFEDLIKKEKNIIFLRYVVRLYLWNDGMFI